MTLHAISWPSHQNDHADAPRDPWYPGRHDCPGGYAPTAPLHGERKYPGNAHLNRRKGKSTWAHLKTSCYRDRARQAAAPPDGTTVTLLPSVHAVHRMATMRSGIHDTRVLFELALHHWFARATCRTNYHPPLARPVQWARPLLPQVVTQVRCTRGTVSQRA